MSAKNLVYFMSISLILRISKQELKTTTAEVQQGHQCIRGRWDKSYVCISQFVTLTECILVIELHNQLIPVASISFWFAHHNKTETPAISNNLQYSVTEALHRYKITTLKIMGKTARHDYTCTNLPNSTST